MAFLVGQKYAIGQSVKKISYTSSAIPHAIATARLQKYLLNLTAQCQLITITKFYGMTAEDQNTRNTHYAP